MRSAFIGILLALSIHMASADELILNNGDRLTGTVVKIADGRLTFKTALVGEVTVAVSEIRALSTASPVKIVLPDRSVVSAPLAPVPTEAGRVQIGDRVVALTELRAINPPAVRWGGKAALGLSVINATKDENKLDLLLNLARTGARDRVAFDAAYLFGRSDEETTTDTWYLNGEYDFARRGRAYAVANARLQQDRIQDLDLRSILGGGLGYIASDKPDFKFRAEGGLAWVREDLSEAPTQSDLSLRLGYWLEKPLWRKARFKHDFTIYPKIDDFGDYYLLTQVILEQGLAATLTLDARFIFDHDTTPAPDVSKSTTKFLLAIGKTL